MRINWMEALREAFTPTTHAKKARSRRDVDVASHTIDPQTEELKEAVRQELRNVQMALAQLGVEVELATHRALDEIEREFRAELVEDPYA